VVANRKRMKYQGYTHYNSAKVDKGQANVFMSTGFAGEVSGMNFAQKN
jgi:hypothetical protein